MACHHLHQCRLLDLEAAVVLKKLYLNLYKNKQTVLFRPSGPHQCSADARMEESHMVTPNDHTLVVSAISHARVLKLVD